MIRRLQRLHGALTAHLPPNVELWLDGGHNEGAGAALAPHLAAWSDRPLYLAVGMHSVVEKPLKPEKLLEAMSHALPPAPQGRRSAAA